MRFVYFRSHVVVLILLECKDLIIITKYVNPHQMKIK